MVGIKLIDSSEVVTSKKTSKIEVKKVSKSPIKIIRDDDKKNIVDNISKENVIVKPDMSSTIKPYVSSTIKPDVGSTIKPDVGNRTIRAIKLKQDIYYGPKNANKNKFVRIYKKLGLKWITDVSINGMMVDGWFNEDKSQYVIKLLEDGDFKRFTFYGCDKIYDYFVDLGGETFDHSKEDMLSSNYQNNKINNMNVIENANNVHNANNLHNINNVTDVNRTIDTKDTDEIYRFVGADLWSGYRTRQLLKKMPDNWGVKWK